MKVIIFVFLLVVAFPTLGQNTNKMERVQAAKVAYITERLGLTTEEAEKFWPIYHEFSDKRIELRRELIDAKKTGLEEEKLVDLGFKVKQQELNLEKDYSGKMMKVISAEKLIKLKSAERDFRDIVIRQIQQRQTQLERKQMIQERQQQKLQQRNN